MSARVWERRRRAVRFWRAVQAGLIVLGRDPQATVRLPEGLVLISYPRYRALTSPHHVYPSSLADQEH